MALKDLRASYLSGNISKPDYRASIHKSLTLLAEIGDLMANTDIKSVNITRWCRHKILSHINTQQIWTDAL